MIPPATKSKEEHEATSFLGGVARNIDNDPLLRVKAASAFVMAEKLDRLHTDMHHIAQQLEKIALKKSQAS